MTPILVSLTLSWRKTEVLKDNKTFLIIKVKKKNSLFHRRSTTRSEEALNKRKQLKVIQEARKKQKNAFIWYDQVIIKDSANEEASKSQTKTKEIYKQTKSEPNN